MNTDRETPSPEPDYLAHGPFSVPARNWFLLLLLWGLLLLKYAVIFGEDLPWFTYLVGSVAFAAIPLAVARLAWKLKGERPYWGDNAFIVSGGVLFIVLSIPAYAIGLGG